MEVFFESIFEFLRNSRWPYWTWTGLLLMLFRVLIDKLYVEAILNRYQILNNAIEEIMRIRFKMLFHEKLTNSLWPFKVLFVLTIFKFVEFVNAVEANAYILVYRGIRVFFNLTNNVQISLKFHIKEKFKQKARVKLNREINR